jgi:hypothetical protein
LQDGLQYGYLLKEGASMITRCSEGLLKISKPWWVVASLVVFLFFMIVILPQQSALAEQYSADVGSPDTSFYYSSQRLYEMAESYGLEGRQSYIQARFTFDLVWPLAYTLFLLLSISWIIKGLNLKAHPWRRLNLVPLIGLVFDYLENIFASIIMARYPAKTIVISSIAGIFTSLKWIFIGGSFVILVGGLIWLILRKLTSSRKVKQNH